MKTSLKADLSRRIKNSSFLFFAVRDILAVHGSAQAKRKLRRAPHPDGGLIFHREVMVNWRRETAISDAYGKAGERSTKSHETTLKSSGAIGVFVLFRVICELFFRLHPKNR
jgi:hypothetical protein